MQTVCNMTLSHESKSSRLRFIDYQFVSTEERYIEIKYHIISLIVIFECENLFTEDSNVLTDHLSLVTIGRETFGGRLADQAEETFCMIFLHYLAELDFRYR